jgi:hypothetical protein
LPYELLAFQDYPRQATEDGANPSEKWGKDRGDSEREDPDPEDYMSIPNAGSGPVLGKTSARDPLWDWPDDDSDVEILEVLNPMPLSYSFPPNPTPADKDDMLEVPPVATGGRKKWAGNKPEKPQPKRRKVVKRSRPMATG